MDSRLISRSASIHASRIAIGLFTCICCITACTEDESSQPMLDRSVITAWQVDTLHDCISGGRIQPWEMLVLDSLHIIIGGYAFNAEYNQFEIHGSTIRNIPGPPVYSLCRAEAGYYVIGGPLFHYLPSGTVNLYKILSNNIRGQSIVKLGKDEYLIGTLTDGIYRFNGVNFTKDIVDVRLKDNDNRMFYFMDFERHSGQLYAVCKYHINDDASEWAYLLKETSKGIWDYVDSCFIADVFNPDSARFGNSRLFASLDDVLFSAGPGGVFRFINETHWDCLLKTEACYSIGGTRSDDMFFGSVDGNLYHYNGSSIQEIKWPWGTEYKQVTNVVVNQDRLYVLTTSKQNNDAYLLRGRRQGS